MWIYFLFKRFRLATKRPGIRLVWRLAVLGVALGVATLLLTQSVLSGFEKVFRDSVLGFNSHLVILQYPKLKDPERTRTDLQERFPHEILASTSFLHRDALLVFQGNVQGASLKGIDPLTFHKVYDVRLAAWKNGQVVTEIGDLLSGGLLTKNLSSPAIILGEDLAKQLKISRSQESLRVFMPQGEVGIQESSHQFQTFRIVGTFQSGLYEIDRGFALMSRAALQKLQPQADRATGLEFRLKHPMHAEELSKQVGDFLGPEYQILSWQKLNGPLFQALRLERSVFFIIMSMVVAVAAFNIVGVLLLMIFDKSREISILRAMGASSRGIKSLFAYQGLWIGSWGCVLGLVFGGFLAWLIQHFGLLRLAKEVYWIRELPLDLSWAVVGMVLGMSLLISFLATQFAVRRLNKTTLDL